VAGDPRLFIAVPLPERVKADVGDLVARVRARVDDAHDPRDAVRWVRTDGLHLTLRFLGPTPEARLGEVARIIDDVAADHAPFGLRIEGAGAFPSVARPRTLWLGVAVGTDALAAVARTIDARLAPLGWPPTDRPFRAHLTLARCDGRRGGPATAAVLHDEARSLRADVTIESIVLFQSHTGGGPARYEPRHEARLGGPESAP
jgi:2'-5' RNA ligase